MSMAEMERQRHCRQRGEILRLLKEEYLRPMTSVSSIGGAADMLGQAMASDTLQFHLTLLEQQAYIQIWRNRDMAGYRRDRASALPPDHIRFAKLTPRGLMLIDGQWPEDPLVMFG